MAAMLCWTFFICQRLVTLRSNAQSRKSEKHVLLVSSVQEPRQ